MSSERTEQAGTSAVDGNAAPGKILAAQREAMGWTVEQVADQLKLAVRQVVALEAGDYAALPGPAVVRGFVRAYAKMVSLDPTPLVAAIALDTPGPSDATHTHLRHEQAGLVLGSALPQPRQARGAADRADPGGRGGGRRDCRRLAVRPARQADPPRRQRRGQHRRRADCRGASTPASAASSTATPLVGAAPPAAGAEPAKSLGAADFGAAAQFGRRPGSPAGSFARCRRAGSAAAATAAAGANALVLTVREDSWIEVKPAKGAPLISRLVKAGSTETFEIAEPVTLVVGKPGAVSATLRGAAVELPVAGSAAARVNLK